MERIPAIPPDGPGENAPTESVTALLHSALSGDPHASEQLLPLVYEHLRALAERSLRRERADHTLQATALVHEAYLRLVDVKQPQSWDGRWHFYSAAAAAMRRILVEQARRRGRIKRGGDLRRVDLEAVEVTVDAPPDDLIALDDALRALTDQHPEKARLVDLRYFGGLTHAEASAAIGVSVATGDRHWAFARAWLYRHMRRAAGNGELK